MTRIAALAALLYVFLHLTLVSPYIMWRDSRYRVLQLEERQRPRLRLVYEAGRLPFNQEFMTANSVEEIETHCLTRLGIVNDSDIVIPDVRVVLEAFDQVVEAGIHTPGPRAPILIEHALQVMGRSDHVGTVSVAPSSLGRPTAHVDFLDQILSDANPHGDWIYLQAASPVSSPLFSRGTYLATLRVEGGATSSRHVFELKGTLEETRVAVREVTADNNGALRS